MRFCVCLAICALLVSLPVASWSQTTAGAVHTYESHGFSVSLPSTCTPVSLGNVGGGAALQEAYSANGLAYLVLAINPPIPKGMSVRTAVSMGIQQITSMSAKTSDASINLISAMTANGEGVQGFSTTVTESSRSTMGKIPPEVKAMFGSSVYQAAVIIPVKDSPATIAVIAVVGPAVRQGEIIGQLMQVANTFTTGKNAKAGTFTNGPRDVMGVAGRGKKKPVAPPAPEVKSISELKKGQIELVGVVKSTDAAAKCVDMLVGQAVPFGRNGAILSPARLKRVFVNEIAADVKEGAIIIVVAGDTGPGKAVTADTLTVVDPSKLGL